MCWPAQEPPGFQGEAHRIRVQWNSQTASLVFLSRGLPDGVSQKAGMPCSAILPHCDLIVFNLSRNGHVAQASLELFM